MDYVTKLIDKVKDYPIFVKAAHTFWQSFLGVFLVGITGLFQVHSLSDAKMALIALVAAGVAAGLSAVKSALVAK